MALSSMLPAVLSSASPLLAQAALPAAAHTSKLLARHMSSFIQAQAPKPAEPSEDQPAADRLVSTFELTFGPLAKHVVETRHYSRIMPEEATFVSLHQSATLLGLQLRPASHVSACSSHRRSALSELVERVTLETAAHSSCSSSRSLHSAAAATAAAAFQCAAAAPAYAARAMHWSTASRASQKGPRGLPTRGSRHDAEWDKLRTHRVARPAPRAAPHRQRQAQRPHANPISELIGAIKGGKRRDL